MGNRYTNLLDKLLSFFKPQHLYQKGSLYRYLKTYDKNISYNFSCVLLDKLVSDGYVNQIKGEDIIFERVQKYEVYSISFEGLLFLERGGYKHKKIILIIQKTWNITKTVATVINAIMILSIAFWTLRESIKEREQEDNNKKDIIKINTRIDSIDLKLNRPKINLLK